MRQCKFISQKRALGGEGAPNLISLYSRITKINCGQTFRKKMPQEIPGYSHSHGTKHFGI
jgi:hypothetical protein